MNLGTDSRDFKGIFSALLTQMIEFSMAWKKKNWKEHFAYPY